MTVGSHLFNSRININSTE